MGDNSKNKVGSFKSFSSRITNPEKLRFTQKLHDIVQICICTNHDPQGLDKATMGKNIFTCVYIGGKIFSRISCIISVKLDTNHP
jgi:hypothetical protein